MPLPPDAPTIASLDLFVSVVQFGSLSAAATSHGITQPSASVRIRQLERQLGVRLLTRGPNGSVPTDAGTLVVEWAQSMLAAFAEMQTAVATLRAGKESLQVAASYTIAEHLLPRWLGHLHVTHPGAHINLEVVNSASVLDRVRDGDALLGFIETPGATKGLKSRRIGTDELVVVTAPDHSWSRRRSPLTVSQLAAVPLILREPGSGTRESLVAAIRDGGGSLAPAALELGSSAAVRVAAEDGAAPAVLSRLAVADALAAGRLVEVAVDDVDLRRELRAVWRPGHALEPALVALLSEAASHT